MEVGCVWIRKTKSVKGEVKRNKGRIPTWKRCRNRALEFSIGLTQCMRLELVNHGKKLAERIVLA